MESGNSRSLIQFTCISSVVPPYAVTRPHPVQGGVDISEGLILPIIELLTLPQHFFFYFYALEFT